MNWAGLSSIVIASCGLYLVILLLVNMDKTLRSYRHRQKVERVIRTLAFKNIQEVREDFEEYFSRTFRLLRQSFSYTFFIWLFVSYEVRVLYLPNLPFWKVMLISSLAFIFAGGLNLMLFFETRYLQKLTQEKLKSFENTE